MSREAPKEGERVKVVRDGKSPYYGVLGSGSIISRMEGNFCFLHLVVSPGGRKIHWFNRDRLRAVDSRSRQTNPARQ